MSPSSQSGTRIRQHCLSGPCCWKSSRLSGSLSVDGNISFLTKLWPMRLQSRHDFMEILPSDVFKSQVWIVRVNRRGMLQLGLQHLEDSLLVVIGFRFFIFTADQRNQHSLFHHRKILTSIHWKCDIPQPVVVVVVRLLLHCFQRLWQRWAKTLRWQTWTSGHHMRNHNHIEHDVFALVGSRGVHWRKS